jgi:hypothetical protein
MGRQPEVIQARGRLTAEADLLVPCSNPDFILFLQLDDGARAERVEFRAQTPEWRWCATGVDWINRTDAWVHLGGTGIINSLWPCRYRASARTSYGGEIVHLELRLYAVAPFSREASRTPLVVLRIATNGDSSRCG